MKISEIIEKLQVIKETEGDVETSCDFRSRDDILYYDEDLGCIFGE